MLRAWFQRIFLVIRLVLPQWREICNIRARIHLGLDYSMARRINSKGFTLIELLIVVAIIGILAAVAIPQFAAYRKKAYNAAALTDLRTVKSVVESYYLDNFYYPS